VNRTSSARTTASVSSTNALRTCRPRSAVRRSETGPAARGRFSSLHFITIDGGSRLDAGHINPRDDVLNRVHKCERARGRPVNFIAVDYTTSGDARGAVNELNAERAHGR